MTKLINSISRVIWDTDLVATRFVLAVAEILWSLMLAWPGDTFGRPTYTLMNALAHENVWAVVFAFSGATQFSIVLLHDYHSLFARYFSCWNAMLWVYVVGSMLASVYPPPAAIAGEIALALASVWIFIRPYILAEGYRRAGYR